MLLCPSMELTVSMGNTVGEGISSWLPCGGPDARDMLGDARNAWRRHGYRQGTCYNAERGNILPFSHSPRYLPIMRLAMSSRRMLTPRPFLAVDVYPLVFVEVGADILFREVAHIRERHPVNAQNR